MTDHELIGQYRTGDESARHAAFAELVSRHSRWMYSSACRLVGDPHTAEDVVQAAFIVLAKKANAVPTHIQLAVWLGGVVRFAALRAKRDVARRRQHEMNAVLNAPRGEASESADEAAWNEIAPYLDQAVGRLRQSDQEAVLLRFYQQLSFAEVGKLLAITEEAARKRVDRAVHKLRSALSRHQRMPLSEGSTLAAGLLQHAADTAASQSLVHASILVGSTISNDVISNSAAISISKGVLSMMSLTKILIAAGVALLILSGAVVGTAMYSAKAAPPSTTAAVTPQPPPSTAPTLHSGVLAIGDRLQLSIVDLVGPSKPSSFTPLIDPDGKIGMPLVQPIPVAGLSPADAEAAVRKAYSDVNLIANANVTISVLEPATAATTSLAPIKAGAAITVRIWDLDGPGLETKMELAVNDQWAIAMPRVNDIQVSGMTERDAAVAIQKAYRDAKLISNPEVEVVHLHKP